jgi:uncharacterized repeat protein (TIGR01451 family)
VVRQQSDLIYKLVLRNSTAMPITNIEIVDQLPDGMQFLGFDSVPTLGSAAAQCSVSGIGELSCAIPSLAGNATAEIHLNCTAQVAGMFTNLVRIDANQLPDVIRVRAMTRVLPHEPCNDFDGVALGQLPNPFINGLVSYRNTDPSGDLRAVNIPGDVRPEMVFGNNVRITLPRVTERVRVDYFRRNARLHVTALNDAEEIVATAGTPPETGLHQRNSIEVEATNIRYIDLSGAVYLIQICF